MKQIDGKTENEQDERLKPNPVNNESKPQWVEHPQLKGRDCKTG